MNIVTVRLDAHLTRAFLDERLASASASMNGDLTSNGLVVDCRHMDGYERDARERFVSWNKSQRHLLRGVAIVTSNPMYRIVIGAMSLASAVEMRAFDVEKDAVDWLQSLTTKRPT